MIRQQIGDHGVFIGLDDTGYHQQKAPQEGVQHHHEQSAHVALVADIEAAAQVANVAFIPQSIHAEGGKTYLNGIHQQDGHRQSDQHSDHRDDKDHRQQGGQVIVQIIKPICPQRVASLRTGADQRNAAAGGSAGAAHQCHDQRGHQYSLPIVAFERRFCLFLQFFSCPHSVKPPVFLSLFHHRAVIARYENRYHTITDTQQLGISSTSSRCTASRNASICR